MHRRSTIRSFILNFISFDITDTLLSAVGGAPAEAAEAKAKAEYEQRYGQSPLASSARLGTQMAVTAPVGGLVAAPLKKVATMAPSLARFLTPVATALETSGFGQTGLTGVKNVATRAVGGAVPGALRRKVIQLRKNKRPALFKLG
jgi:hypothetical protein